MKLIRLSMLCLALGCSAASAQWQWLDKDGRNVFSDRPPPADIPARNILHQPGARGRAAALALEAAAPASAASGPRVAASGLKIPDVDKELAEKKKQADDAEAARLQAQREKNAAAKQDSCNRARQAKVQLDSAMRVRRVNEKGDREIMDMASRDAETRRVQAIIESDCS